ncbi:homoprotocatechuate degradation operon regulator HpaR [Bradyrhizobium sp. KB893862 SZCCT0404]|uniref:homoprotocatechuate degradation operon regulator HpaR n=1 Tax=Bradyrhizobium sp. KB893862 SZCCT0404 TaxID=2807672 RepID=UPI001BA83865|nr:homoprotocatechuate degradation operon regulator HpaR [Bradyrhizobium sp. KB893862 SZCCT0404]MBR1175278.1 homoprotocatechuate degradation operon regulator HpaR [Bradyrhizobium sp. KB893862 SZCCT0404]
MDMNIKEKLHPRPMSRTLPIALLRGREVIMSKIRPMLTRFDLNEQQYRVLRALNEAPYLDAREVSKRASILAPSLTRIMKILEKRGLIKTGRFEGDSRRILLSITRKGADLIQQILPESRAVYQELDRRLGHQKVEQLLNLLEDLVATDAEE